MRMKEKLHEIIFEAETPGGKAFDVVLLIVICFSVFVVMLESVDEITRDHGALLRALEWSITALFTFEYAVRIYCVRRRLRYIFSFYGIVDLLAILPTYISLFVTGAQSLLVIRGLRLLRIFRIFKLTRYLGEANVLMTALRASAPKITVFLGSVLVIVIIVASLMYLIEGGASGFENIPKSMYWAVVTLTTVGYGDVVPTTVAGKILAGVLMIMGYGIIAVPTGIVSAELVHQVRRDVTTRSCPTCLTEGHDRDAVYCRHCGAKL